VQRGKTYDIVVANIIARILIAIADDLTAGVKPGGLLLLSGIIEPREAETRAAFSKLELIEQNQIEDWISLSYRAPS
jgi:ribosomal protein L11 methyltransferase